MNLESSREIRVNISKGNVEDALATNGLSSLLYTTGFVRKGELIDGISLENGITPADDVIPIWIKISRELKNTEVKRRRING